jgi:phosphoglucosamine mutase
MSIVARTGRRLSELAMQIPLFPQQQRTIHVRHKDQWEADPTFAQAVEDARQSLDGVGRILVRPSGTEPALRIMVEGKDAGRVLAVADDLAGLATQRLN